MSITADEPRSGPTAPGSGSREAACAHCGAPLQEDQEWCLECGAARTRIHRPPDWRIPLAIVGTVVVLVLAGFAIALIGLSNSANRTVRAKTGRTTRASAATPAGTTPAPTTPAATTAQLASWPVGLSGWTVVLGRDRSQLGAETKAQQLASAGVHVGVLDSNQHPSMRPGYWIVFSGRYPDKAAAAAAALKLRDQGHTPAHAREVAPPGGL